MNIIKRDGSEAVFCKDKIVAAIQAACRDADQDKRASEGTILRIADSIEAKCAALNHTVSVEEVQDMVEDSLIQNDVREVAKAYIRYRYLHKMARSQCDDMMKAVAEKLSATNVENQNANLDERSFGGRMGEAARIVTKQFALDYCMSEMARNNHLNNEIYIHDLDSYAVGEHNCLSIPFDKLLANGFNTRQCDVRPANSANTAFQLVAVIFQLQSLQQFGGVSATHLDWTMVPYVRKSFIKHFKDGLLYCQNVDKDFVNALDTDYLMTISIGDEAKWIDNGCDKKAYDYAMAMTEREVYQAVEGMYHNLNTLQSRSGNQLPFTSINYGTCTEPEGRMVTRAILGVSIDGLGKLRKTSIFPCGIFQMMNGVNRKPGDPNYDLYQLALRSTAQRLYPNYANVDWTVNEGYDPCDPKTYFSTMGCRTSNGYDINGMGQTKDGRGNICPVTLILPTLAMEAKEYWENNPTGDDSPVETFMNILNTKLHEAKDMLLERYHWICSQDPASARFMYENGTMEGFDGKTVESAMKHGTLAVGLIGMAETLQILIGCNHTEPRGMELAKRICALYKERCAQFKKEEYLNFGVYFTPAENLCYTAMKKFKAKYGEITNVSDRDFFTNSIHVPVWEKVDPFTKINIESQLTGYSNAGCITYVEFDSTCKNNISALEAVVNYAMDKDIPYFAINVPNDTCLNCGFTDEIGPECPMCGGEDIQRLRRVTGYLTGDYKTAFNYGKQKEVEQRIKHSRLMPGANTQSADKS